MIGPMIAVIPKTRPMFAILEPITLLIAIAGEPSKAACKLTNKFGGRSSKRNDCHSNNHFRNIEF